MSDLKCKKCRDVLSFRSISGARDVDGKGFGICKSCESLYLEKVKTERFVEEYKDINIYLKEGVYYASWESFYSFKDIKSAKEYIDYRKENPNLAIVFC